MHTTSAQCRRQGWEPAHLTDVTDVTDVTDETAVATEAELRALVGEPVDRVRDKVRTRLHPMDRLFLSASPFWLLATSSPDGANVSPKGDPAGSVLVMDDTTLDLPDRPGNKRLDGYLDVLRQPAVGLLFVVPGRGDTLRVNGDARIVREGPFFDTLVVQGKRPSLALVVDVREVFFHCIKAFLRSGLWDPSTWAPDAVPSRAERRSRTPSSDRTRARRRSRPTTARATAPTSTDPGALPAAAHARSATPPPAR